MCTIVEVTVIDSCAVKPCTCSSNEQRDIDIERASEQGSREERRNEIGTAGSQRKVRSRNKESAYERLVNK